MSSSILEVKEVGVHYGQAQVLRKVSLDVQENEVVAVLGPNGAGKTTLLSSIAGLASVSTGMIHFMGHSIVGLPSHEVARKGIALVPEGRQIFQTLTVYENLKIGAYRSVETRKKLGDNLQTVFQYFPQLEAKKRNPAVTLSGGQQQMLVIGRALMSSPRLLMIDEPLLGLAPKISYEILAHLRDIAKGGTPLLLVEQNLKLTLHFVDKAYVLYSGEIVAAGGAAELRSNEDINKKYFGSLE